MVLLGISWNYFDRRSIIPKCPPSQRATTLPGLPWMLDITQINLLVNVFVS
jgi:hypothetical protein